LHLHVEAGFCIGPAADHGDKLVVSHGPSVLAIVCDLRHWSLVLASGLCGRHARFRGCTNSVGFVFFFLHCGGGYHRIERAVGAQPGSDILEFLVLDFLAGFQAIRAIAIQGRLLRFGASLLP
jgi:hypothetical protein